MQAKRQNQWYYIETYTKREIFINKSQGLHGLVVKNPPSNARDTGSISWSGRSPGVGNGDPLQNSYLENPMDRGAWWATVHGVTKSRTRLSMHTHMQGKIRKCFLCNIGLLMRKVELFLWGIVTSLLGFKCKKPPLTHGSCKNRGHPDFMPCVACHLLLLWGKQFCHGS